MFDLRSRFSKSYRPQEPTSDVLPIPSTTETNNNSYDGSKLKDSDEKLNGDTHNLLPNSVRGPWKFFDRLTYYLPRYDGKYSVGTLTLEIPIQTQSKLSSPLRLKDGEPALKIHNSLITIFYPTLSSSSLLNFKNESRLQWITSPQVRGYLKFARINSWKKFLAISLSILTIGRTQLPTLGSPPIAVEEGSGQGKKRQLLIFCHGLTGNRTCYSQLCGQLAARGYVVAAIEHRDGSGSHSVVNGKRGDLSSAGEVPYIDLVDLSDETRPENYLIARAYQLELRTIEVLEASKILAKLASKEGDEGWKFLRDSNLRVSGSADWFGDDGSNWDADEWRTFSSAVDWDQNVIATGHSFGGGTIMACARLEQRPKSWAKLIAYDPWLETLDHWPKEGPKLLEEPKLPILVINSPGFSYWPSHFENLLGTVKKFDRRNSWILTIGGIIHTSFSDLTILFDRFLRYLGKLKLDSQKGLELIVEITKEFIEEEDRGTEEGSDGTERNQTRRGHDDLLLNRNDKVEEEEPRKPEDVKPGEIVFHLKP